MLVTPPIISFHYETLLPITRVTILENARKQWSRSTLCPLNYFSLTHFLLPKKRRNLTAVVTVVFLEHTKLIHIETKTLLKILFLPYLEWKYSRKDEVKRRCFQNFYNDWHCSNATTANHTFSQIWSKFASYLTFRVT